MRQPSAHLYKFSTYRPGKVIYYEKERNEPLTPPRFLIEDLPEDIRRKASDWGETWHFGEDPFQALQSAGVSELSWRQPLCHIEGNLVSDEVFGALRETFGADIRSERSFQLSHQAGRPRLYHQISWSQGWPVMADDPALAGTTGALVVRRLCNPPLADDEWAIGNALRAANGPVELAFPSWLDRDDRILHINGLVVTEGLRARWEATSISEHLRTNNSEHDIWFTESAGGYDLYGREITFRWVNAPVFDWVEE